jgi:hypothetical protein
LKQRHGIRVLRIAVNRIDALAGAQSEPRIASRHTGSKG